MSITQKTGVQFFNLRMKKIIFFLVNALVFC